MCSQNESQKDFCIFLLFKKPIGIEDDFGIADPVSLLINLMMKIRPWASVLVTTRTAVSSSLVPRLEACLAGTYNTVSIPWYTCRQDTQRYSYV